MSKFKVGQEVECLVYGKGVIRSIRSGNYPIVVEYPSGIIQLYTIDGWYGASSTKRPLLTNGTWKVEEILPEPIFEKCQPVWFKNCVDDHWKLRYYSHKENGQHFIFMLQQKDGATHECKFIKPFEGKDPNE